MGPIEAVETKPSGVQDFKEHVQNRKYLGWGIGAVAVLAIVAVIAYSFVSLHTVLTKPPVVSEKLVMAGMICHAAIAVALVFFCYQLLKAAERLMLPYWWASENVEVARVLLGIDDPVSALAKIADKVSSIVKK